MAYGKGPNRFALIPSGIEKSGCLRGADPFVAIACIIGRSQGFDIQWKHSWRMSAINQGIDTPFGELINNGPYRQDHPCLTGHMIDEEQTGI